MFLIPILFHNTLGLPLTIVIVVALIGLRVLLERRGRARRDQQRSPEMPPPASGNESDRS